MRQTQFYDYSDSLHKLPLIPNANVEKNIKLFTVLPNSFKKRCLVSHASQFCSHLFCPDETVGKGNSNVNKTFPICTDLSTACPLTSLTSVSIIELDVTEARAAVLAHVVGLCVSECVGEWKGLGLGVCGGESTVMGLGEHVRAHLGEKSSLSLGTGETEGVTMGEGRGERVPISMARSSVQARLRLRR